MLRNNSKLRILKWFFIVLIFVVYSIISVKKSWNDDFRAYYQAGNLVLSNVNIYDKNIVEGGFLYTPLFAMLMIPLSLLPQPIAATFWYLFNVFALVFTFIIALFLNDNKGASFAEWFKVNILSSKLSKNFLYTLVFVIILSARFWLNNIEHGQVNIILWFIVLCSITAIKSNRLVFGSALLAFAVMIKPLPLLLLFYYLLRGKYRIVSITVLFILILLVAPFLTLGWNHNLDLLASWYQTIIEPSFKFGAIGVGDSNQSFPAMLTRFLTNTSANELTGSSVNFLSLSDYSITLIIRGFSFLFLGIIALLIFKDKTKNKTRENLAISLVLLTCVLLPALSWKAFFIASILGYTTVVYILITTPNIVMYPLQIALITASFAFHTLSSDGIWGWAISHTFQSYSCVTISILLLYVSIIQIYFSKSLNGIDK